MTGVSAGVLTADVKFCADGHGRGTARAASCDAPARFDGSSQREPVESEAGAERADLDVEASTVATPTSLSAHPDGVVPGAIAVDALAYGVSDGDESAITRAVPLKTGRARAPPARRRTGKMTWFVMFLDVLVEDAG